MLLTLDPGKHGCGVAYWCDGLVVGTFVAPRDLDDLDGPARWVAIACAVEDDAFIRGCIPDVVVVETMHVYTTGRARPGDLLELQSVAAAVCARFPSARHVGVEARKWKGQVPRGVLANRVTKKLRDRGWWDRVILPTQKTQLNDILHAIGIGFYFESLRVGELSAKQIDS